MTLEQLLEELRRLPDVVLHPGASSTAIKRLEQRYGIQLPAIHRELLLQTNGIEADGGYLRLYGVGPEAAVDMGAWNEPELWKFSWHPVVRRLFSFGGDGWGMQFAYLIADLGSDVSDAPIYMVADSDRELPPSRQTFRDYLERGLLANARAQLSEFSRRVRREVGDLTPGELVTLAPHPIVGGPRRVANVVKMPAVSAMVVNGDINTEWLRVTKGLRRDGHVTGVVPYVDEQGRGRIRLRYQPSLHASHDQSS
jgi:hypothetical protein